MARQPSHRGGASGRGSGSSRRPDLPGPGLRLGRLHNLGFLGPDISLGHCISISGHPAVGGDPDRDLMLIADALGRDDLGRLAPSARADIVCVDMSGYHYGPVLDPVRFLVAFGKGQDVDTAFVDGCPVVQGGRVANTDEHALRAAAPGILCKLARAASQRDPRHRTLESILGLEA